MKLSIAELRRRLPAGTRFTARFLRGDIVIRGNTGTTTLEVDKETQTREVVKQTASEMVSVYLTGPRKGREVTCTWRGVSAREDESGITLTQGETGEDFLLIRIEEGIDRFYRLKDEAGRRERKKLEHMRASGATPEELRKQEEFADMVANAGD